MKSLKTIKRLLETKGREIFTVGPDQWVFDAIQKMADKSVGALLVMTSGKPVGIISERDYARKVILQGRSSKETKISEIMTTTVVYCKEGQTIEECMAIMTEKHVRHLPVLSGTGDLCGFVSLGDLVKNMIAEQKFVIEQLENYIYG
ncbi:MAG: CBS domain-containing protein [Victivallales bacterium]|jgi:CBS domain-containing protein|nr:CBS domain-containing protein [Victivallales bacterium]MBT7162301.1 CBS domain-containing protein [Victivallales bacterium]MBT7299073.1 CBS domain-containing protein [Victivallales bacterium]